MTLRVDIGSGRIETNESGCSSLRLARFVALLALSAEGEQPEVSAAQALLAIGASVRQPRPLFHRLLREANEQLFLRGVIDGRHKTAGPWFLAQTWRGRVDVRRHGEPTTLADLGSSQASVASRAIAGSARFTVLDREGLMSIVEGDHAFARGQLAIAARAFSWARPEEHGPILGAIATARLLQTHIRTEDHAKVLAASRRLHRLSHGIENPVLGEQLRLRAELGTAWHTYAKDHEYALAHERLLKVRERCQLYSNLHIDWLNLYGLSERRLALDLFDRGQRDYLYRERAQNAVSALCDALTFSLAFGTPYQIQKACANLANVAALFITGDHAGLLELPFTSEMVLSLLGASEHICKTMGIGRDDLYNPIYIMSAARKFGIRAAEEELWARVGLPQVATARSLAAYGDREYTDQGDRIGPEQRAFLAYEVCWAAVDDDDRERFEKYAEELTSSSLLVPDGNKSVVEGRMAKLLAHLLARRRTSEWLSLAEEIRDFRVLPT